MNLMNRIKKLYEKKEEQKELFSFPDFENWSDRQLDQYIVGQLNKFHFQDGIKNYEQAEKRLLWENQEGLLSDEHLDILLQGEKQFWELASKSKGDLFFCESLNIKRP